MFDSDDYYEMQDLDLDLKEDTYQIFGLHHGHWKHVYNADSFMEANEVAFTHDNAGGYYELFKVVDGFGANIGEYIPYSF